MNYVPYTEWRRSLIQAASSDANATAAANNNETPTASGKSSANVLAAVLSQFSERWDQNLAHPKYDHSNLTRALKGKLFQW